VLVERKPKEENTMLEAILRLICLHDLSFPREGQRKKRRPVPLKKFRSMMQKKFQRFSVEQRNNRKKETKVSLEYGRTGL
jgi:hypothetical protein